MAVALPLDLGRPRCYARRDERSGAHHPARDHGRRAGDRAPARAHVRSRPLRQNRLSSARAGGASARPVVHRAHRHAAGRFGAAVADPHRRDQGAAARPADGRAGVPRAWRRSGADRARAERSAAKGHSSSSWSATSRITANPASSACRRAAPSCRARSIRRGCWSPSSSKAPLRACQASCGRSGKLRSLD